MPRTERTAEIEWEGNLARGHGELSAGSSGAFRLPFTLASRIGNPEGKTSPEELLAAAHGGCFTTSLAGELTGLGHPPERLEVSCRIALDEVAANGHQIVGSEVTVRATVPGIDEATFSEAVRLADEGCPFASMLRRSGAEVTVDASFT